MVRSCFFIGHRDTNEGIYPRLLAEVKRHVEECGVTEFFVGHYGEYARRRQAQGRIRLTDIAVRETT